MANKMTFLNFQGFLDLIQLCVMEIFIEFKRKNYKVFVAMAKWN